MDSLNLKDFSSNMDDYFIQKKIETMLEINNKKLAVEINPLKEAIKKLSEEILELKERLNKINNVAPSINQSNQHTYDQAIVHEPKKNDSIKPRYGDYNPEDVAISKMFYFGKR